MTDHIHPEIEGRFRGRRIVVLLGGETAEREVSLATGGAIARALVERGYDVLRFDWQSSRVSEFVSAARGAGAVFIALHGGAGEGGAVQGLLDIIGTPYTGSGTMASALAMNKHLTKTLARGLGVPTADWVTWQRKEARVKAEGGVPFDAPLVVKPAADGSSHGISILHTLDPDGLKNAVDLALTGEGDVMLERFVDGREITVAMFDGKPLGVCEIRPADGWYDYASKYQRSDTSYLIPSTIGETLEQRCMELATGIYTMLQCRGIARVDFIVETRPEATEEDPEGQPRLLELNTIPGMTSTSLVPKIAQHRGVDFATLSEWILDRARCDGQPKAR